MRFESMMKRIKFDLFDVSRLMIDDEVKLKAFHNEISSICEETLLELEKHTSIAFDSDQEREIAYRVLGYEKISTADLESLYDKLDELIRFTIHPYNKNVEKHIANTRIIEGFLKRSNRIIKVNVDKKYKLNNEVLQETNETPNTFRVMTIGTEGVVQSVSTTYCSTDAKF